MMDTEVKCKLAVKALGQLGIEECLEAALSLVTPVMLGHVTLPQVSGWSACVFVCGCWSAHLLGV